MLMWWIKRGVHAPPLLIKSVRPFRMLIRWKILKLSNNSVTFWKQTSMVAKRSVIRLSLNLVAYTWTCWTSIDVWVKTSPQLWRQTDLWLLSNRSYAQCVARKLRPYVWYRHGWEGRMMQSSFVITLFHHYWKLFLEIIKGTCRQLENRKYSIPWQRWRIN